MFKENVAPPPPPPAAASATAVLRRLAAEPVGYLSALDSPRAPLRAAFLASAASSRWYRACSRRAYASSRSICVEGSGSVRDASESALAMLRNALAVWCPRRPAPSAAEYKNPRSPPPPPRELVVSGVGDDAGRAASSVVRSRPRASSSSSSSSE